MKFKPGDKVIITGNKSGCDAVNGMKCKDCIGNGVLTVLAWGQRFHNLTIPKHGILGEKERREKRSLPVGYSQGKDMVGWCIVNPDDVELVEREQINWKKVLGK